MADRIRRATLIRAALTRADASQMALRWIAYAAGEEVGERGAKPRDDKISAETNAQAVHVAQALIEAVIEAHQNGTLKRAER